ncbi:hypothetical protein SAMN05444920_107391 [Nonomuraea solani]|uniref:Uncharacterized protein n=1 Tax=Nonomuraea solani TaxID=1144553 RepID=A0A1H6E4W2_9ACTN|nr:hypothetical protein [Nonomuraea solani]SEG91925.1 hypothetical protein SAMN05444920_107391 [Nonomuraea solani]
MNENSGIYIAGNAHVQADAMAAGSHAQANSRKIDRRQYGDVRTRLDDLLTELRATEVRHPELRAAIEAAEQAGRELAADEPDPGRVMGFLSALGAGVSGLSTLAAAVAAIEESVRALLQ